MTARASLVEIGVGALLLVCLGFRDVSPAYCEDMTSAKKSEKLFKAEDLFRLRTVTDVQISPDGRQIVFEQGAGDIQTDRVVSSLWMIDSAGGAPRRLVEGSASGARWSPDSRSVAYLADDAKGNSQIQVIVVETGHTAGITQVTHGPSEIAWSPDGRSIAFTSFVPEPEPTLGAALVKPAGATWASPARYYNGKHYVADGSGFLPSGHTHLFVVPATGGEVRQITSGSRDDAEPVWSRDGADLIFTSADKTAKIVDFDLQRISQVTLTTGKVVQLSPEPINASGAVISPDGQQIAFIGWAQPHPGDFFPVNAYVMRRDGSQAHVLDAALDRLASGPQWSGDGRAVLIAYDDRGLGKVARLGLDGSFQELADGVVNTYSVSRGGRLAFPLGGADHPEEVGTAEGGKVQRLTHVNAPWLEELRLGTVKPLAVKSSLDGAEVGAWVVLPPGYEPGKRYPTILKIHGGPHGDDSPYWDADLQLYAAAGYAVVFVNYRGSTSYGLKFSTAIDRNFPGPAYDDLMSAVDAAISSGVADPARLFVTGGSAGGELTAWIVGKTNRFRAAVSVKPVVDNLSHALQSDQYLTFGTGNFAATPWDAPMVFWQHSPLSLVGHVATPTLLMVGEEDHRTPLVQAMEFYDALQIRGVPSGLMIVPGASHESLRSRPSQRAAEDRATMEWFGRYRGPAIPAQAP